MPFDITEQINIVLGKLQDRDDRLLTLFTNSNPPSFLRISGKIVEAELSQGNWIEIAEADVTGGTLFFVSKMSGTRFNMQTEEGRGGWIWEISRELYKRGVTSV